MRKIVLSAFVLAGISLTSCDKNDDNAPQTKEAILPVKYTTQDEGDGVTEFNYDAQNRLTRMTESYEGVFGQNTYSSTTVTTFEYNGGELVKITEDESYTNNGNQNSTQTIYTVSKSGNTVTLNYERTYDGNTHSGSDVIIVNENGYILSDEETTYSYDAKGNILKETTENSVVTFEYDDKNGIFKNVKTPQWALHYLSEYGISYVNNFVKATYEEEDFPEENNTVTVSYQYNAANYPVSGQTDFGTTITIHYNK